MATVFKLKQNDNNAYYFHLVDGEGKVLMTSAEYPDKDQPEQGIKELRVGSLMSEQIAAGQVPEGDQFFVIKNSTGDVVAKSVLFESRMVFDHALHTVRDNACIAEISDLT